MIISRTPYRISFFGGGTDYPTWFREHGGAVLSTTIDKYCYINARYLPPFFEHKFRVVYSVIESVRSVSDIKHVSVRECIRFLNIMEGLEIHHDGDLPARSGIGSSSSFTVGLLKVLYALRGEMISKYDLAKTAIHVEQNLNKESVGSQDQVAAAFGGFNKCCFHENGEISVEPVIISENKLNLFQDHFLLYFTGFSRTSSDIAVHQIESTKKKENTKQLSTMRQMVDEALNILGNKESEFNEFGLLLDEAWRLKRSLTDRISTDEIDLIYEKGKKAGALGGKLLGAGGGGFILFFVEPGKQDSVRNELRDLLEVPFRFENQGSQIIFYNNRKII